MSFLKRKTSEEREAELRDLGKLLEELSRRSWLFRMQPYPAGLYGVILRIILWSLLAFGVWFWIYLWKG